MPSGNVRTIDNIRYFRKDHFCPECGAKLEKVTVSKVVNSRSPEAKDFDFGVGGISMVGDVRFTWDEFACPSCRKQFSVDEIKQSEGIPVPAPRFKRRNLIWGAVMLLLFLLFGYLKSKNIL